MSEESNVFHIFPVLCPRRDELQEYLRIHGIQTLIHYPNQELSLPISPVMLQDELIDIVRIVNDFK